MEEEGDYNYMKPALPVVPEKCGPATISLNLLLDFAIQQIFHEITVLTELLPKKLDGDKKISLVQFAHNTRMLFVKLLALVKWIKSSKKADSCSSIAFLLEQQAQYFTDTADRLLHICQNELVFARLPAFQITCAVDTLALGSFVRLPTCIRDRFVPSRKIDPKEQSKLLQRINQVLEYRISKVASKLSPRIQRISIRNGILSLTVPGEFSAQLTILGEKPRTKWSLLNIQILVEDHEIGFGAQLVHPLQLQSMHDVLQSRMDASKNPLEEVYLFLHAFAQSLQLDVLFCQATQLAADRMNGTLVIERYDPKERTLTIGYWLQRLAVRKGMSVSKHTSLVPRYRLVVHGDKENPHAKLRVRHFPPAAVNTQLDDTSGQLCIDKVLSDALLVRCRERLVRIRKRFEVAMPSARLYATGSTVPSLTVQLLNDAMCSRDECIQVTVNMFSGRILCTLNSIGRVKDLVALEKSLYDNSLEVVRSRLQSIRILLIIERYKRSIAGLQVRIVGEKQMCDYYKKLDNDVLPENRMCLQFLREENYYLVVGFIASDETVSVKMDYYLLSIVPNEAKVQMLALRKCSSDLIAPLEHMRLRRADDENTTFVWKQSVCEEVSLERELANAIASVDDRISFMRLCEELDRRGIKYTSLESEPEVGGLVVRFTDPSSLVEINAPRFFASMRTCCLRIDNRGRVCWPLECLMQNIPLIQDMEPYLKSARSSFVTLQEVICNTSISISEAVSSGVIERIARYAHIYNVVERFSRAYHAYYKQRCSVKQYSNHKLIIAYGERRSQMLIISFRFNRQHPNDHNHFSLNFGQALPEDAYRSECEPYPENSRWNPHCIMSSILQQKFNKDNDLVQLVNYLIDSNTPLQALANFSRFRVQSYKVLAQMLNSDSGYPVRLKCIVVPLNEYTIRLTYATLHLEFVLLEKNKVAVRDSCRERPRLAGLQQFFEMLAADSGSVLRCDGVSPVPPHSLPLACATRSPCTMSSLSVPPAAMRTASPQQQQSKPTSNQPIIIDHATLVRACTFAQNAKGVATSPLEEYLFALSYIERSSMALEAYVTKSQGNNTLVPINGLHIEHDSVRFYTTSVTPQHLGIQSINIYFAIYLDANMQVKLDLRFAGDVGQTDQDVQTMQLYFTRVVCRLNNEMALLSFVNVCRITVHKSIPAIANIMHMQLMPPAMSTMVPSLHLVFLYKDSSGDSARKFNHGVIIDHPTNSNVMIIFCFRNRNIMSEKHLFKIFYSLDKNQFKLNGQHTDENTALLNALNQEAQQTGESPLYNLVRRLLERSSTGDMPGSVQMPSSVQGPVSVGPVSVGPIGSVSSLGHNPGSIINPSSNL